MTVGLLLAAFADAVADYLADPHYRGHFLFLWVFFGAALFRCGRHAFVGRAPLDRRGVLALWMLLAAVLLQWAGLATGSGTVQRLALVAAAGALLVLAGRGFTLGRCAALTAFAIWCFGVPFSVYFGLTRLFRNAYVALLQALPTLLPLDYRIDGATLHYGGYALAITQDCSGFNQVVTFVGLAFVGALTGRAGARRVVLLFVAAIGFALTANLTRLLVFVVLVGRGVTAAVDDPSLHQLVGFVALSPFVLAFIALILRTHRPLRLPRARPVGGGLPVIAAVLPFVVLRALFGALPPPAPLARPDYVTALQTPPGFHLQRHADSEELERRTYDTPWVLNATFAGDDGLQMEVFAYLTSSRQHLNVHRIANCLDVPGTEVRYGPAIEIDGRTFWSVQLDGEQPWHGFYSFWVDGADRSDGIGTQVGVFVQRLTGGARVVGLTRLLLPGALRMPLPPAERDLLRWRASQLAALDAARAEGAAPGSLAASDRGPP